MKIAMIDDAGSSRDAGTGLSRVPHLTALSGALAEAGHEVTVYVRHADPDGPAEGAGPPAFRVVPLTAGPAWSSRRARSRRAVKEYAAGLADRLRSDRPDIVHLHSSAEPAAMAAVAGLDLPLVYTAPSQAPADDTALGAERAALAAADRILASHSEQVRRLRAGGVHSTVITLVPRGVDVEHFSPDGTCTATTLPRRVVAVGDLVPASGFGTAVAALAGLPNTELVLIGGSPHSRHAGELRRYARSLGVADRVRLAGWVPRAELPSLLRSADVMVCSPRKASFGVAALEAMACGVAVVANGRGGLADTVVNTVTGVHVPPRRPRELATALRKLLAHKTVCEQQGAAGRDRAWARYPWARVAQETVLAYRRTLDGH